MTTGGTCYTPINCPQCGMDNVVLVLVEVWHCQTCGATFGRTA